MDWETVRFDMLGRDAEDGTSAHDELNRRIQEVGRAVLDMANGDRGSVQLRIDMKRTGPGSLSLAPKISVKMPGRCRPMLGAVLADGTIQAVEHKQTDIADVLREARELDADEAPEGREQTMRRKRELSERRRAEGRPVETEGGES